MLTPIVASKLINRFRRLRSFVFIPYHTITPFPSSKMAGIEPPSPPRKAFSQLASPFMPKKKNGKMQVPPRPPRRVIGPSAARDAILQKGDVEMGEASAAGGPTPTPAAETAEPSPAAAATITGVASGIYMPQQNTTRTSP